MENKRKRIVGDRQFRRIIKGKTDLDLIDLEISDFDDFAMDEENSFSIKSFNAHERNLHDFAEDVENIINVAQSPIPSENINIPESPIFSENIGNVNNELNLFHVESDACTSSSATSDSSDSFENLETNRHSNEQSQQKCFIKELSNWAITSNIPHKTFSNLLVILNKFTNFTVPNDARTMLKTPRRTQICNTDPGKYVHFGFKKGIENLIQKKGNQVNEMKQLDFFINIDGLPISKSSTSSLWLLLCSEKILKSVFIVGAYHGFSKPSSANEFLGPFVNEAKSVIEEGVFYKSRQIKVNVSALICDAPAKAFVMNIKGHTGYDSCTKCAIKGKYLSNRICFPSTELKDELRTDEDFRLQKYADNFQMEKTILIEIPNFGPISNVPFDYMHLICLGVVKRLILLWTEGPTGLRLSLESQNEISVLLRNLRNCIPQDFSRRPRSLKEAKQWKATEFRQFLLYTGPVVLRNINRKDMHINFVTFHIATTILCSPDLCTKQEYIIWAQRLIQYFLDCFKRIYGSQYMSHNFHGLLHLTEDVKKYGPLDSFSAFQFENHMTAVKKLLRKPDKPLQQLAMRYTEIENASLCNQIEQINSKDITFEKPHVRGPIIHNLNCNTQYSILKQKNFELDINSSNDNCICLNDNTIVKVKNFVETQDKSKVLLGKKCIPIQSVYFGRQFPCDSNKLNIHVLKEMNELQIWPCQEILCKMWKMPYDDNLVVFPIIQT